MKKRHVLHLAMGVVMTPLLGSCAADEIVGGAGSGNGVLSFGVEVNAGAPEVKPMGGATRSGVRADSSATGNAMMSPDVEGFFPTSSIELSSVDGKTLYANCDERRGINMHNNVDYKTTRGSIITQDNFYDSFALYGYVYDSGKNWKDHGSSTDVDSKIKGITMSKNGNGNDYNASGVYWPGGSKKATFFAVAPYSANPSVTANQGGPQITYTVPQDVSSQKDLLIAKSDDDVTCDGKNAPSLKFYHALAAIKFVKGENLGGFTRISNVEISGVYNKGTLSSFTPSDTNNNLEWTGQTIDGSGTNTYTISESDLSNVLFLMPQTIPDGAEIKVTFSNGSNTQNFTAKLKDDTHTTWEAGHQYTYKLSVNKVTGKFIFEVTSPTDPVPVEGGNATFNVKSYFEYDGTSEQKAVKFNVESNGDTNCSIGGSDTDISRTVTLSFSANNETSTQDAILKAKDVEGTENNPVDLSIRTKDGNPYKETANCYVVNAPGYYKFPIVYGNGIVGGNFNSSAFDSSNYVTHDGTKMNTLSSAWISGVSSASLVWQDANGLIANTISIIQDATDNNNNYISFYIPKSSIKQGNAVIAVKNNSDQIMWSWHIWVTALDVYSTQTVTSTYNGTTKQLNFMPVPLGWNSGSATVNPKAYTLSVKQEGSGKTANGIVTQAGQTGFASGTCTFYQWGRKDPFPPSNGSESNITLYAYETTNPTMKNEAQTDIQTSIMNPLTFYVSRTGSWENTRALDLWNVGNTATDVNFNLVTKSVYDPSPAGFHLPCTAAFTGFTTNNGTWNNTTKGYTFTNGVETYWQACGYRASNRGSLDHVGSYGYYWSAGPRNTTYGCNLSFLSGYVYPQNYFYRAYGFSVRPVSE